MQYFGFIVVKFHISRQMNKPKTVTVSQQTSAKKEKTGVCSLTRLQQDNRVVSFCAYNSINFIPIQYVAVGLAGQWSGHSLL